MITRIAIAAAGLAILAACPTVIPDTRAPEERDLAFAKARLAAHDPLASIAAARRALAIVPRLWSAHRVLVRACKASGQLDAKLACCNEPLGDVLAREYRAGLCGAMHGDFRGGIAHLRAASREAPEDAEMRCRLGFIALSDPGDGGTSLLVEANGALQLAVQLAPRRSDCEVALAHTWSRLGNGTAGRRALDHALTQGDELSARHARRARAVGNELCCVRDTMTGEDEERYRIALDWLEKHDKPTRTRIILEPLVKRYPKSARILVGLALAEARVGNQSGALGLYRTAMSLAPYDPVPHFLASSILAAKPSTTARRQAISELEAALAGNPAYLPAREQLGALLLGEGRAIDAVPQLHAAVSLGAPPARRLMLARALLESDRADAARSATARAAGLLPTSAEPHLFLAEIDLRQLDQAHGEARPALLASAQRHTAAAHRLEPASPAVAAMERRLAEIAAVAPPPK